MEFSDTAWSQMARRFALWRSGGAAKRFYEAAGTALELAMEAAVDDLPRLYIPRTLTEKRLAQVVRLAALFLASGKEALASIEGAHLEADLIFRDEMALEREKTKKGAA